MSILFPLFCLFLCFFSSCQKQKTPTSTLRINTPGEPPTLDVRKNSDNISAAAIMLCFDGLTRRDVNNNITLSLAQSYSLTQDKKCYTFVLKDAYWSNGSKITAFEFEETWKEILNPNFPAFGAFLFYKIKNGKLVKEGKLSPDHAGIKALDEKTLQVELEHPMESFLELVSTPVFYPYPGWVADKNLSYLENKKNDFICNGPFCIREWKSQHHMIFQKNPSYWDHDTVRLNQIKLSFVLDQTTELSLYEQGELDWCGAPLSVIPTDAINLMKTRKDFYTDNLSGLYFYLFNTSKYPLNNANIRKALTLAIDRKNLIDHVIQVNHGVATNLVPKIVKSLKKNFFEDGDHQQAKIYFQKGLEELGITLKEFPKIELSFNTEPSAHYKIAQAIQQQWYQTLGVKTTLKNSEWKVYLDQLNHSDFQIARLGVLSCICDASFFIELFAYKNMGFNYSHWHNSDYENLFLKSQSVLDTEEKLKVLSEAETIFMDEMPLAPIYFYSQCYLKRPYVKNVVLSLTGSIDYKWAYLDHNKDL